MRWSTEEYSKSAQKGKISKAISIVEVILINKKETCNLKWTLDCPGCGDVYEEPLTEDWIKRDKCWVWVTKELVVICVVIVSVFTLTCQGVQECALYTLSFLRFLTYWNVFPNKSGIMIYI